MAANPISLLASKILLTNSNCLFPSFIRSRSLTPRTKTEKQDSRVTSCTPLSFSKLFLLSNSSTTKRAISAISPDQEQNPDFKIRSKPIAWESWLWVWGI
eukprot:TRINITY_DN69720_c1_g1_i1.p1 TRINITY_DN69720_c1_g1~~TRINITY_DN69720_c1_g1_i1.p1  ORF type:complete len:100 (+),score=16.25 TRINITY_DN69720_c1_g1_i1:721-1020(+)